ncbi:MAG TPA: hypothetical protein PLM06_03935 [Anaerolineae bacterium]|nr:hypothetical protein [Anaerolineae bacterium]
MVIYHLYRDAFSEVYTYRYRLADETGAVQLIASWPGLPVADRPEEVLFHTATGDYLARLRWEDRSWWHGDRFWLSRAAEEPPFAMIEEQWRLVDRLLLRLPGYRLTLEEDGVAFSARGSRYSQQLYEIFALPTAASQDDAAEQRIGAVRHPASGPTYIMEVEHPRLEADLSLIAALGVILDLWGVQREQRA